MKKGIYAANFGGGQVDITSGKFVFSMSEAYLIENGKLGPAIKGATLIGNGPDALTRVSMIGSDMKLDPGSAPAARRGRACRWRRPADAAHRWPDCRRDAGELDLCHGENSSQQSESASLQSGHDVRV